MGGIGRLAGSISADLKEGLPGQRKTQREKVALLVATMLAERQSDGPRSVAAASVGTPGHALSSNGCLPTSWWTVTR